MTTFLPALHVTGLTMGVNTRSSVSCFAEFGTFRAKLYRRHDVVLAASTLMGPRPVASTALRALRVFALEALVVALSTLPFLQGVVLDIANTFVVFCISNIWLLTSINAFLLGFVKEYALACSLVHIGPISRGAKFDALVYVFVFALTLAIELIGSISRGAKFDAFCLTRRQRFVFIFVFALTGLRVSRLLIAIRARR
jgi:hypothetical protein